jgi:hypothetical protein
VELRVQVRVRHRVTQCAIPAQFFFSEIKPEHLTQRFGQIFQVYRARNNEEREKPVKRPSSGRAFVMENILSSFT